MRTELISQVEASREELVELCARLVAAPRWRSVASQLHVEASFADAEALGERGHDVVAAPDGDGLFGAVVSASFSPSSPSGSPGGTSAVGDWRRGVAAGAV